MDSIVKKISNLIDVKTIVTFIVIGVFAFLAVTKVIDSKDVMIVVIAITTYFFSRQNKASENTIETNTIETKSIEGE